MAGRLNSQLYQYFRDIEDNVNSFTFEVIIKNSNEYYKEVKKCMKNDGKTNYDIIMLDNRLVNEYSSHLLTLEGLDQNIYGSLKPAIDDYCRIEKEVKCLVCNIFS